MSPSQYERKKNDEICFICKNKLAKKENHAVNECEIIQTRHYPHMAIHTHVGELLDCLGFQVAMIARELLFDVDHTLRYERRLIVRVASDAYKRQREAQEKKGSA